jgi:hypothetical protein
MLIEVSVSRYGRLEDIYTSQYCLQIELRQGIFGTRAEFYSVIDNGATEHQGTKERSRLRALCMA